MIVQLQLQLLGSHTTIAAALIHVLQKTNWTLYPVQGQLCEYPEVKDLHDKQDQEALQVDSLVLNGQNLDLSAYMSR